MGVRLVALLHLRPGTGAQDAAALERAAAELPGGLPGLHRAHLGRHLPGSIGGGDYTWDALLDGAEPGKALDAVRALPAVGDVDAVAFEPQQSEIAEPGIRDCVKRTLLLRVFPDTPAETILRFERDLLGMPRHIGAIRNWALSRTDPARHATGWTHVWEQEFADPSGLAVDYMVHPYHWGLVDGWFDPECPQRIVDTRVAHVSCRAPETILGWI